MKNLKRSDALIIILGLALIALVIFWNMSRT